MRLNKYLAHAGICSRRAADEHIKKGLVTVNNHVIREMGHKVEFRDKVRFKNEIIIPEKKVYILLNKPKDTISTTTDPQGRKTVLDVLGASAKGKRLYPVGRLDRNTTGLLLITNDGDLSQVLAHPSFEVSKLYEAELDKPLTQKHLNEIREHGVELEEGLAEVEEIAYVKGKTKKTIGIQLHIGWNRVVRRLFEAKGYRVKKLDRVLYANLTKKDLPRSRWRYLEEKEIITLKHFLGTVKPKKRKKE